jgi:hypothetical protein
VVAEVNLKLIWDVISAIKVGDTGHAYVLDAPGRLIAHPDISLVLRGVDEATLRPFRATQAAVAAAGGAFATGLDTKGQAIAAAGAPVKGPNWTVIAEQPLSEAFGPLYAALQRTGWLILAGSVLAGLLAFALARRMTKPIQLWSKGLNALAPANSTTALRSSRATNCSAWLRASTRWRRNSRFHRSAKSALESLNDF